MIVLFGGSFSVFTGCGSEAPKEKPAPGAAETTPGRPQTGKLDHDEEPPPPPPSGRPVVAYVDGKAEKMTEPQAIAKGLTVVDLSNYWVPFIFSEKDGEDGHRLPNEFRPIFRKLANDWHYESRTRAAAREIVDRHRARVRAARIRELKEQGASEEEINELFGIEDKKDGGPKGGADGGDEDAFAGGLGEADNFLEVFGIPPSLSVLRKRAMEELNRGCYKDVDFDAIRRFDGFVAYKSKAVAEADAKRGRPQQRKMRREMERLGIDDPFLLLKNPKAKASKWMVEAGVRYEALAAAQKLLVCEGIFEEKYEKLYWSGGLDWKTHQALLAFEHKNRIFGWGYFGGDTLKALGKMPIERLFDAFQRVLAERVIDSARIIEDGSAKDEKGVAFNYKDEKGEEHPVRNLVAEFTAAALRAMDLGTPEKVAAFLKSHTDEELDSLFVALPLPEKPPYYSDIMELSVEIDRGDVWYDYPYDDEGNHRSFPRKQMPITTLFVHWNDQKIPLVKMNTTIGGWRTELASDGYEYYKYKNSDVGPKVWRDIVAGPVWLPPDTTPKNDLIKEVRYRGQRIKVPNYDEFGPWYASAYGLVAAFHVRPWERKNGQVDYFDNGIRSHGSVDYNSILRRFSHGCHRLYNHLAIRLFDFVLRHREFTRVGQIPAGYSHKVVIEPEEEGGEEETYIITLDSKGYKYELKEPVPVNVLTGRIRGKQRIPIETYMPKPGVEYKADAEFLPEEYKAKLLGGDAGPAGETPSNPLSATPPTVTPIKSLL